MNPLANDLTFSIAEDGAKENSKYLQNIKILPEIYA